jgi:hypothetical protein
LKLYRVARHRRPSVQAVSPYMATPWSALEEM